MIQDIYYKSEYISLYLKENDSIFEFENREGDKLFYNIAIKKPIKKIGNKDISPDFFDLETGYGYGGIYCNTDDKNFITTSLNKYIDSCRENRIIAEFYRINPFNKSSENFEDYFDFINLDRSTVYVNCELTKEERWNSYVSKTRTILRKCEKELTFESSTDIEQFMEIYNLTMKKNNADDFYFFDKDYFSKLIEIEGVELFFVKHNDVLVSASFVLFDKEIGHYHLSANNYSAGNFNANYFVLDQIFDTAHERGIKKFHLGGGRTNEENDSLFKFKKKFSSNLNQFYIAGKVFNKEKYEEYNNIWESQKLTSKPFFLKYRL